ncbi:GntR family transcriptional regulator [Sphaerotilus microaerophilus]|uniref:GntR family transcriptional regulator n=1 Tax=Sphaerotilus microaerophilus TaxID=2914710 RepID=A0ABM7YNI6_9BURK|nr:FCD domain-containing protein [Sphaerotilus sp. FB-5]BDI06040.1 GntR family transcriptional regulator [Sphaerotilus sp. FB-5]
MDLPSLNPASSSAPNARSLTTMAFERLRSDILLGELKPDERLRIQGLSERYSVGATAIREALSRLVTDGLVESEDQRGFCVAPVSREELQDLTATRVAVEQIALRGAIAHGGVDWESHLLSSFHRLLRAPLPLNPSDALQWSQVHRQFHESLLAGCGSTWTLRLCRLLYDKSERYRNLADRATTPHSRDTVTEHRQLMDAAMARDAERACELLSEHFWETTQIILKAGLITESGKARRSPGRKAAL